MPLSPGARVGPYEITAAIGAGGMGEVYRARNSKLGRDVAVASGQGKQFQSRPLLAGGHLHRRIHPQPGNGGSPHRRRSDNFTSACPCLKAFAPHVPARVEKKNDRLRQWVNGVDRVGFVDVAGAAGQREIRIIVGTAARRWFDVFDFEGKTWSWSRGQRWPSASLRGRFHWKKRWPSPDFKAGRSNVERRVL